jgi:hypothetical protein
VLYFADNLKVGEVFTQWILQYEERKTVHHQRRICIISNEGNGNYIAGRNVLQRNKICLVGK